MSFRDLDEFFDPTLRLPIRGRTYEVPSPDVETGLRLQRLLDAVGKAASGAELTDGERDLLQQTDDDADGGLFGRVLGPAFVQMREDNLPWAYVKHAAITASIFANGDTARAEAFWGSAGSGEAPSPQSPPRSGAGSTTRRRASTSGTKRPAKTQGR